MSESARLGIPLPDFLAPVAELVEFLVLVAYASDPDEWIDRVTFVPQD